MSPHNAATSPNANRLPTPAQRTSAVLRLYRSRASAPTATQRTYTAYLIALVALILGGPAFTLARNVLRQWLAESATTTVQTAMTVGLFALPLLALHVGKFAGPFTINSFVMRVLTSSNIPPRDYLSRIAAPRIAVLVLVTTALCAAILSAAIFLAFGDYTPESVGLASALLTAAATAVSTAGSWVLGQIAEGPTRLIVGSLILTAATAAVGLGATKALPVAWLLAAAIASLAVHASARAKPSALLEACTRVSTARMFVATGAAHYALDLYDDAPRKARGSALLPTNRLRSSVGVALVRLLRSPGDTAAKCAYTSLGAGMLVWSGAISGSVSKAVVAGAGVFALYLGLGRANEFWRALRGELALRPLYGGGKVGAIWRQVGGLSAIFVCCATIAGALTSTALFIFGGGIGVDPASAFATSAVNGLLGGLVAKVLSQVLIVLLVALAAVFARTRNAHKGVPHSWLLRPLHTPLGDVSGLMLAIWQAEGVLLMATAAGALILAG